MKYSLLLTCAGLVALSASAANPSKAPNLHELMKNVVAVQTQIVWDVSNKTQDDNGNPDASKLTAADWTHISAAASKVRVASQTLAAADHVMAAAPGQKLQDEGNPGAFDAKAVQAVIDSNPKAFNAFAQALAASMNEVIVATQARDAKKLNDVAGQIDQICEQCHVQFWYPNQQVPR